MIDMEFLLEFKNVFQDEDQLTIEEYLMGCSRNIVLRAATFLLGLRTGNSKYEDNRELLRLIFGFENNGLANDIYNKIKRIEESGTTVRIENPYSSLKLFECFFSKSEEEKQTQTDAQFEVNFFKAYLVLNSEFVKRQEVVITSTEELDVSIKPPAMIFCMHYPVFDKVNYDIRQIWATQFIKAFYLFEFLQSHTKTKKLLDQFLSYFGCTSWREYLSNLVPLTIPAIQREKESHVDITVKRGEKFKSGCEFVEKLIVKDNDSLNVNDFLTIRAKPLYKISEGVYRIIMNLFVVEKVFKGTYFHLRDINLRLPNNERIAEIKSFYGSEFSEKTLVYKVVSKIFPPGGISLSGEQMSIRNGYPDYYIRRGKEYFLIRVKGLLNQGRT